MGVILDLFKEIPLSAIMRERIIDLENKIVMLETENAVLKSENAVLKSENAVLKAENAVLKAENAKLRLQLQQLQEDEEIQGDPCPYCRRNKGELMALSPHKIFGDVGLQVGSYKCQACGKEYERQHEP